MIDRSDFVEQFREATWPVLCDLIKSRWFWRERDGWATSQLVYHENPMVDGGIDIVLTFREYQENNNIEFNSAITVEVRTPGISSGFGTLMCVRMDNDPKTVEELYNLLQERTCDPVQLAETRILWKQPTEVKQFTDDCAVSVGPYAGLPKESGTVLVMFDSKYASANLPDTSKVHVAEYDLRQNSFIIDGRAYFANAIKAWAKFPEQPDKFSHFKSQ